MVSSDNRMMAKDQDEREKAEKAYEDMVDGWTCVCGTKIRGLFACPACGLTVVSAAEEMERIVQERGGETWDQEVSAVHELANGDPDAGSGEGVDGEIGPAPERGGVVAGAGAEEGGYTHRETDLTSDANFGPLEDEGLEITFDEKPVVYGGPDVILPIEEPSEEDVRAYDEMGRGDATGGNYMLGLFFMYCLVAIVFFLIGMLYGRATYGF